MRQTATSNTPLTSPVELMQLLINWVTEKDIREKLPLDIQTIWNLVEVLDLRQPAKLLEILEPVSAIYQTESTLERHLERYYGPLPRTLDTYIIDEMITRPTNLANVNAKMKAMERENDGDELLRYRIKVVRDTFLWLEELLEGWDDWVPMLTVDDDIKWPEMRKQLTKLNDTNVREFEQRSRRVTFLGEPEVLAVDKLWKLFDGNKQLPVRFAFCLARLKVAGRWKTAGWPRLYNIALMLD